MAATVKLRVAGFAGAIVAVALTIGWAAHNTLHEVSQLDRRLSREVLESFRTADQFRVDLTELSYTVLRLTSRCDPADWQRFFEASKRLDDWIYAQAPFLTTDSEKAVFEAMNAGYVSFQDAARQFVIDMAVEGSVPPSFDNVERESKRLLDLSVELLQAQRGALNQFVQEFQRALVRLRWRVFGALALLLALGVCLAVVVYREMVAPLHLKLAESQATIARQEKLASLGVLAAGVAHEIRNPLTAIKARLFTQQKALRPGAPEHEDGVVIGREINRLENIVKGVLQFARPEEPAFSVLPAAVPLQEVRDFMAPQLEKNGIKLVLDSVPEARINADPGQLKQVLLNLIQNAADAIGRNGTVTLRARTRAERLRDHPAPAVVLEVQDTGPGIPAEVRKRLFDPFFSTKENGTGLGLAIAARIVEQHGGSLTFQTEMDRGTTFAILLPAAK